MMRKAKASVTPFIGNRNSTDVGPSAPAAATTDPSAVRAPDPAPERGSDDPLLTLKCSSGSFLDSVVVDEWTKRPLFMIETIGRDSAVLRSDPNQGVQKIAKIHWPRKMPKEGMSGVRVQLAGHRWRESEDLLKFGSLFTSRKFNIPGFEGSLKWRRAGSNYSCTTEKIKRPIALLDRDSSSAPPRLRIFEPLLHLDATVPQSNYAEIPTVVLDMLLVTALLLVTDGDEWKGVSHPVLNPDGSRNPRHSAPSSPSMVNRWRAGLQTAPSIMSESPRSSEHIRPISPTTSAGGSSDGARSDYPGTPASAPERPFRYDDAPPVPPVPAQFRQGWDGLPSSAASSYAPSTYAPSSYAPSVYSPTSARPSARPSSASRPRRELPVPPGLSGNTGRADQPWLSSSQPAPNPVRPRASVLSNASASTSRSEPSIYPSSMAATRGSFADSRYPSYDFSGQPLAQPFAVPVQPGYNHNPTGLHAPQPAGAADILTKLAQEKQYTAPARADSVTPRIRDSNFFGDIPGSRDTVFDLPPPAYDAIYHGPPASAISSANAAYGADTPDTTPTPWQNQFGRPQAAEGGAGYHQ